MKILDYDGLKQVISKIKGLIDKKVEKIEGKELSTNDFDDAYKERLNNLNRTTQGDTIYDVQIIVEDEEAYLVTKTVGKLLDNDFHEFPFTGETLKIQVKSEAEGYVLLYGKPDYDDPEHPELKYVANETEKATRLAMKVDKNINSYLIDFTEVGQGLPGQKFYGNLVITNVTMPEDKVSVIREEGL